MRLKNSLRMVHLTLLCDIQGCLSMEWKISFKPGNGKYDTRCAFPKRERRLRRASWDAKFSWNPCKAGTQKFSFYKPKQNRNLRFFVLQTQAKVKLIKLTFYKPKQKWNSHSWHFTNPCKKWTRKFSFCKLMQKWKSQIFVLQTHPKCELQNRAAR